MHSFFNMGATAPTPPSKCLLGLFLLFFWSVIISIFYLGEIATVMSPNIARPLTLRTSPSDYATFNQIKSFFIFSIRVLLEREKQQKFFTLNFHC